MHVVNVQCEKSRRFTTAFRLRTSIPEAGPDGGDARGVDAKGGGPSGCDGEDGRATAHQVKDKGVGISRKAIETIFSDRHLPIKNFSNENEESLSNGMGLLICKNICEQLEGKIEVDSILGKGSIFTFTMRAKRQVENLTVINEESDSDHQMPEVTLESG